MLGSRVDLRKGKESVVWGMECGSDWIRILFVAFIGIIRGRLLLIYISLRNGVFIFFRRGILLLRLKILIVLNRGRRAVQHLLRYY